MQVKSILAVIGALVPIAYCGGLLYYFVDGMGGVDNAQMNGLGPTLLGLAIVGLLFFIPLAIKLVRAFVGTPTTTARDGSSAPKRKDTEEAFDADAVVARYLAKQAADRADGHAPAASGQNAAPRATFGRKVAQPDMLRPKA